MGPGSIQLLEIAFISPFTNVRSVTDPSAIFRLGYIDD